MSGGIVSLCTGFGALDRAVQEVFGGRLVAVADTDRAASALLAHHYPGVPNLGDIANVDWSSFASEDWVTVGWPCQPWSVGGLRKGAEDERAIWPEVARAIGVVRPRHVLLENVPAIAAAGELARAVGDLAALGYVGSWRCVSAASVGAPHLRERIFIVASDSESLGHDWPWRARHGRDGLADRGVTASDADLAGSQGAESAAGRHVPAWRPHPDSSGVGRWTARWDDGVRPAGLDPWRGSWIGPDGADYGPAIERWGRVLGRAAPGPTVLGPKGGRVLSPYLDEWLMGAPEGWITSVPGLSRADMVKLCGNGVVRQAAVAALRAHFAGVEARAEVAA